MRAVVRTEPGRVELNYMWLPTFIGMNKNLKDRLEARLAPKLEGLPLTEETLQTAHNEVVAFIVAECPGVEGLDDYLDGLKYVTPKKG